MATGRSESAWSHTSSILAMLANIHRDPKKTRPYKPNQFNPHLAPKRHRAPVSVEQLTREMMAIAKQKQGRR